MIRELIEAVERGDEITVGVVEAVFPNINYVAWFMDALRPDRIALGSALALMQAVLPGWRIYRLYGPDDSGKWRAVIRKAGLYALKYPAVADTPARALLLAILKAKEGETP